MLKFMLESGMSLYESLINIRDSSIDKSLKNLARIIADEVRQGSDLSGAMRKSGQFDIAMVQQINSGEESGNIDDTFGRLTEQIEREIEFKATKLLSCLSKQPQTLIEKEYKSIPIIKSE